MQGEATGSEHLAFSTLPGDGRAGVAAERRKNAAHGVSRGSDTPNKSSSKGAKER